ncbi:conserved hypothetical protein [Sphingomonas sp. EC-HK361]|nr:conserved hypothetical protein [Sphingomonas sp. EC-HK361]
MATPLPGREGVGRPEAGRSLDINPPPAPPFQGGEFGVSALRLAGLAGVAFGWRPGEFWAATPAELRALVTALAGGDVAPPDGATVRRLREAFPDG